MKPRMDVTGHTFGRWTALGDAPTRPSPRAPRFIWCRCTCGYVAKVRLSDLRNGQSGGCIDCHNRRPELRKLKSEIAIRRHDEQRARYGTTGRWLSEATRS